ncbi:MAG: radical SAM protein, partial [Candidatus Aenigmatarchaeota archaeon]
QDFFAYGKDIESNYLSLLEKVIKIKGNFFVRVGMGNVNNLIPYLKETIETFKNSEKIYKFLHIPVQSGSNKILSAMRRKYTVEDWKKVVYEFKKEIPEITIWTDIIVGFPGETEEDFDASYNLIKEVKPDYVNVSRFSSRPGTEASKLKQLNTEIVKERTKKISEISRKICLENNKKWVGWEGEVLVTEKLKTFVGRNFSYKQIILPNASKKDLGKIIKVKIIDSLPSGLVGEKI